MPTKGKEDPPLTREQSSYEELAVLFRRRSFLESSENEPRVTLEDVQRVAQECPAAFLLTDKRGDTLLHLACYCDDVTVEILALLHQMNPALIDQATSYSCLSRRRFPKECMMYNRRAPPDAFSFLVENSNNSGVRRPDDFYLEMRFMCQNERFPVSASKLRSVVETCPEVLRMQIDQPELSDSDTPLQILCTNNTATLEAVAYLYEAYPGAISLGEHGLPLHKACYSGLSREIIDFLTHHYPEAVRVNVNHYGTPLHCHLNHCINIWDQHNISARHSTDGASEIQSSRVNIELVRHFVEMFPQALEVIEDDRGSPLHTLVRMLGRFSDNAELIALVIEMAQTLPAALRVQNARFYPLLHVLCAGGDRHVALARVLVDMDPTLLNFPAENGQLPIHAVCKNMRNSKSGPASMELLKCIIDRAPETVMVAQMHNGNLPIHELLGISTDEVSHEALQLLVECNDSMLKVANRSGDLAVHLACRSFGKSSTLHNVQYLVTKYPVSTKMRCSVGRTPLDIAISERHQDTVDFLLEKDPDIALEVSTEGISSIHRACRNGSLETIKKIHKLRPNLLQTVTSHGRLPLVFAIQGEQELPVIIFLLQEYPNSIVSRDNEGALPFHHACLVDYPEMTLIKALFKSYPSAIHTQICNGKLLMEILCGRPIDSRAKLEVLQFLACQLPYSLGLPDAEGRYPLHRFCQNIESVKWYEKEMIQLTLEKLHELNPDAIRHESAEFGLPIHCACKNICGLEMLQHMVKLYPESIDHNHRTLGLPLHSAIECHDEFEFLLEKRYSSYTELNGSFLVHALLEDEMIDRKKDLANALLRIHAIRGERDLMRSSFPRKGIEQSKDYQGRLPLHLAVSVSVRGDLDDEFIEKLIGMYHGALYDKDHQGMLPLHHAFHNNAPEDTMYMLVKHGPDAMALRDKNNCLPFHHGCQYHQEGGFMESFMNDYDCLDYLGINLYNLCKERANNGDLPLHKACLGGNLDCISTLVAAHPLALKTRNHAGMLPVFLLCQELGKNNDDFEAAEERYIGAIFDLLRQNPEAILLSAQPQGV